MKDLVDNNPRVKDFKKQAKILLRQLKANKEEITLTACHDLVAQQHGYKHWYEFYKEVKNTYQSKEAEINQYFFKTIPTGYISYGYSDVLGLNFCLNKSKHVEHTMITEDHDGKLALKIVKQAIDAKQNVICIVTDDSVLNNLIKYANESGREKDLKIIRDEIKNKDIKYDTLPVNLHGSCAYLVEVLSSLIDYYPDDGIWKGRSISMINAILSPLVYMRDNSGFVLNFESLKDYLELDKLIQLSKENFPPHISKVIKSYLQSLPGFNENNSVQSNETIDRHGYVHMLYALALGPLMYFDFFSNDNTLEYKELFSNNRNLIFLIKCRSFKHCVSEMEIAYKFLSKVINLNLMSNQEKSKKTTWLIQDCPIYTGFSVVPAQAVYGDVSIILSYSSNDFLYSNLNELASVESNCKIKIKLFEDNKCLLEYKHYVYSLKV